MIKASKKIKIKKIYCLVFPGANPRPTDRVDGRGGASTGGEGTLAAGDAVGRREGTTAATTGHGNAQEEGYRICPVRCRSQTAFRYIDTVHAFVVIRMKRLQ